MRDELVKLMGGEVSELVFSKSGPTVILLAGLQGVGKTTVSAKLAFYLKKLVCKQILLKLTHFMLLLLLAKFMTLLYAFRERAACLLQEMFTDLQQLTNLLF